MGVLTPQVGGPVDIKSPGGTRGYVVKFPRVFQWSSILQATFEHKTHTRPDIFLEKNMSNFFFLVSNYMLHGLGLLGRIEPARKARSPLGVSGNRGFYLGAVEFIRRPGLKM